MTPTEETAKPIRIRVSSEADLTHSLLECGKVWDRVSLDAVMRQKLCTAVSELARNILKYAGSGEVVFSILNRDGTPGVEVTVRDRGPGIEDLERALSDNYSTSGTLGLGLPGVKRMMDEFKIESAPGQGTKVVIRKWKS